MKKCNLYLMAVAVSVIFIAYPNFANQENDPLIAKPKTERLKNLAEAEADLRAVENAIDEKSKQYQVAFSLEMLGTFSSFAGDTVSADNAFDRRQRMLSPRKSRDIKDELKDISEARAEEAITAIVREAKNRQIVILNDAHHVPMHRAFAMLLARELKKLGFEYLACEMFGPNQVNNLLASKKGVITEGFGFYAKEPMAANFLQEASNANWKFVSYEQKKDQESASEKSSEKRISLRDVAQAKNLVAQVFAQNPKARLFIYAGYGHGWEWPVPTSDMDEGGMGGHLKRLTGIDPLTIDQTRMYQHFESDSQMNLYEAALKKQMNKKPFVLKSRENNYLTLDMVKGGMDMQVVHPAYGINADTGRPSWLGDLDLGFSPRDIPKELLPTKGRRLIYTYRLYDPVDAIPVDMVLLEAGKPVPKLMLPKGEYRYAYED